MHPSPDPWRVMRLESEFDKQEMESCAELAKTWNFWFTENVTFQNLIQFSLE